jgi:hypothetical protein
MAAGVRVPLNTQAPLTLSGMLSTAGHWDQSSEAIDGTSFRLQPTPGGTLGHRGPERQGRARPNGANTNLGEAAIDDWTAAAESGTGRILRAINKAGRVWGDGMTAKVLWQVVRQGARRAGIEKLAPHDLRRTCARLCHLAGGELDQIQFLLGHVSIQTTERYLGCKQKLRCAVNDRMGIEPTVNT